MRFDYKTVLQNKYILYLFFIFVLLQLIVFLQCGDMYYAVILLITGAIISYFQKNMIIILFSTLIITYLVKWGASNYNIKEGLTIKGLDTTSDTSTSSTSPKKTDTTVNMSSSDIKQAIEDQEIKKKELANDINTLYLNNQNEIANLVVIKQQLENKQASVPT